MSRQFIPSEGHFERQTLAAAFSEWLCVLDVDQFVTLTFNREWTLNPVRHQYRNLLASLDRQFLGRRWCRRSSYERTFAIAVAENRSSNLHLHALMRLPEAGRRLSQPWQAHTIRAHWSKLQPAGSCDVQAIYDLAGVSRYVSKQLSRPGYFDDGMIISSEFHNNS
jgi:hypothetical protein